MTAIKHTNQTVVLAPGEDGLLHLRALDGWLLEVPVFEPHFRGTNYVAIVGVDGSCPGGLSRRFIDRGKGAALYSLTQVTSLDVIEFAGDYTTSVGSKRRNRVYGVVVGKSLTELVVKPFEDGVDACVEAAKLRAVRDGLATGSGS